ncbi:MAG TPA: bifunctional precorrin-2 dehydrogenase/sirohydrochlorin ferrochelatase [Ktedonobacteraceae bacterium]|jgi:precorrin-2 dehydrogenase/sirohydrochlorin ferrochelatase|nr:bifunctional precorrin-2 dehydrogenase/sirohydrochlorin ferrochelatase [Ktedonobacteraceae bacterium]
MPNYYPVMLDVRGRLAIVIGGDRVAAEKAAGLSASGADVHVIAPQFCEELLKQAEHKRVALRYKAYELGDLDGAFVVVAATNDPQLVQAIWNETQERGQLVNIVDVPAYCSFILPSILRREPLTITVSTEGTNPSLAKRIRHDLEEIFPPAYGTYLQLAALARGYLRQQGISYDRRDEFFSDFHTSEVLKKLVEGDISQATAITSSLLQRYGIEVPANTLAAGLEEERAYA